jgi:hypothetical protein
MADNFLNSTDFYTHDMENIKCKCPEIAPKCCLFCFLSPVCAYAGLRTTINIIWQEEWPTSAPYLNWQESGNTRGRFWQIPADVAYPPKRSSLRHIMLHALFRSFIIQWTPYKSFRQVRCWKEDSNLRVPRARPSRQAEISFLTWGSFLVRSLFHKRTFDLGDKRQNAVWRHASSE